MTDSTKLKSVSEPAKGYNDLKFYFANLNTMFSIRNTLAVDMMTAMPLGSMKKRIHDRQLQNYLMTLKIRQTQTQKNGIHGI